MIFKDLVHVMESMFALLVESIFFFLKKKNFTNTSNSVHTTSPHKRAAAYNYKEQRQAD